MNSLIGKILGSNIDPELVNAYRSAIPSDIQVDIAQNGDLYLATIKAIEHKPLPQEVFLVTEAKTETELVDMVNDLIFAYKRIMANYRPLYRQILMPEGSMASATSLSLVKSA